MATSIHEVQRPFTGMGQDLQRYDQVDTADWPRRRVRMLVQYGMLRPIDPPPAPPATDPPQGPEPATQGAGQTPEPEPPTRRGRAGRKED